MFGDFLNKKSLLLLVFISLVGMNVAFNMSKTVFSLKTVRTTKINIHRFSSKNTDLHSKPRNICIIGGGLAGLSTTFHLLEKIPNVNITIIDKVGVGQGGASSVAGG